MPDSQDTRPPARPLPEHVTLPLLDVITRNSLDQDYRHVADARAAAGAPPEHQRPPRRRTAIVVAVFGVMLVTAAVQSSREASTNERTREQLIEQITRRTEQSRDQQREIRRLRDENERASDALADLTRDERAQARRTLDLAGLTGFAAVRGEGVRIRVDDSPDGDENGVVLDEDLATLVDGLWAAGAEAISINGRRLTALSGIRTAGSAINVQNVPIRPPYTILAIGDTNSLQAEFVLTPSGSYWMSLARTFDYDFEMQNAESLTVPAAYRPELSSAELYASGPETKEVQP